MNGKTIINIEKPQTQTVDAIKALLSWRGRAADPLPSFLEMGDGESRIVLVLSNKKDCFYTVTALEYSCPARSWHPNGPCKHMRRYFSEQSTTTKHAIKQPNHGAWHGHNGPIIEDGERPFAKAALSSPLVDCQEEPNNREVAYHEIMETRQYWPLEA